MQTPRFVLTMTLFLLLTSGPAPAQTRPARDGLPPALRQLQTAIDTLDLSPDQKQQVAALKDRVAETVRGLAPQLKDASPQQRRERVRTALDGVREDFLSILTPEQKQKLTETLTGQRRQRPDRPGNENGPATRPIDSPPAGPAAATAPPLSFDDATSPATRPAAVPVAGQPAPPFALTRVTGSAVSSKSLAGKPLVIVFGSLSSPKFRDRVPQLEALRNRYRTRVNLLVVYTREAHPADGWPVKRNRDDKLEVRSPTTDDERVALARQLIDRTKMTLDLAVDTIDDATARAYGDTIEGAAVVSPYGTLIGTQTFCDPSGLPRLIDLALQRKD